MHEKSQNWKVPKYLILELAIVKVVTEKEEKMLKNVQNAKEEESCRN